LRSGFPSFPNSVLYRKEFRCREKEKKRRKIEREERAKAKAGPQGQNKAESKEKDKDKKKGEVKTIHYRPPKGFPQEIYSHCGFI
jgi:hypothetical protein